MGFEQERIAEQIDISTLTRVVLTHLHFDHAGGLALSAGGADRGATPGVGGGQ